MRKGLARVGKGLVGALTVALVGCELEETSMVRPDSTLVAEVQVVLDGSEPTWALAYLHATQGGEDDLRVAEAEVEIRGPEGAWIPLRHTSQIRCLDGSAIFLEAEGSCFMVSGEDLSGIGPGDELDGRIRLPGGEAVRGTTRIPGAFRLERPSAGEVHTLPPDSTLRMEWTQAPGSWGYVVDARLILPDALAYGRQLPREVNLLGLAPSRTDTSFDFPAGAGVLQESGDMAALLEEVDDGLPHGSDVDMAVGAVDENLSKWLRGTNFHPSGQVRVPSLWGDGTGVFGSVVQQHATLEVRHSP